MWAVVAGQFFGALTEVVHRINVFKQLAFIDIANTARLAGRVKFASKAIGLGIEVMIVLRFIDANAPDNDRGMVPVALYHTADILDRLRLPGGAANVLPARDLFEHEQTNAVAMVEEVSGLWVVRGAHDIALQHPLHQFGILFLC